MFPFVGQAALAGQARRQGGRRQREAALAAATQQGVPAGVDAPAGVAARPDNFGSELVSGLVQEWAWGGRSAADVQRTCLRAFRDKERLIQGIGASTDHIYHALRRIAQLGNEGNAPQHVRRELVRYLGEPNPPKPLEVRVLIRVAKHGRLPLMAEAELGV